MVASFGIAKLIDKLIDVGGGPSRSGGGSQRAHGELGKNELRGLVGGAGIDAGGISFVALGAALRMLVVKFAPVIDRMSGRENPPVCGGLCLFDDTRALIAAGTVSGQKS